MSKPLPNRRSIRFRGYDYSQPGLYFITICTYQRECLFGEIIAGKMILNEYGQIAYNCWLKTEQIRSNIILGEFIVMPNHFHAVFIIDDACRGVLHTPVIPTDTLPILSTGVYNTPLRSPSQTVGAVVRGYKSAVTKRIGFSPWQRNYHEHIIRNHWVYERISQYIINNPTCWQNDCFYE